MDQIGNHSGVGSLPFILAPGLLIGAVLVAIGLYRARLAPRWPAILLGISVVPVFVAPSGGALGAVLHLPLCVAIAALGVAVWRSGQPAAASRPRRACLPLAGRPIPRRPDLDRKRRR